MCASIKLSHLGGGGRRVERGAEETTDSKSTLVTVSPSLGDAQQVQKGEVSCTGSSAICSVMDRHFSLWSQL